MQLAIDGSRAATKLCGSCSRDVAGDGDRVKYGDGDYRCRRCHLAHKRRKRRQERLALLRRQDLVVLGAALAGLLLAAFVAFAWIA